tara:strand:+ start:2203 stop:2733 length:531 start_codon:yes stop_codon:yes gene_type:complete
MKNPCLVIIDVQEKLFPMMNDRQTLLENLIILIKGFQLFKLPVIITEQVPEKLGNTIEEIASLFDKVDPIIKSSFSCIGESKFSEKLETINADNIILAGIESHVCIYQTSYDLLQKNKNVEVVLDSISSRNINDHNTAIARMKMDGVSLTSVEMLLFFLQKSASGDTFRKLVKLVK